MSENLDCITPKEIAKDLSDKIMPNKSAYRKTKTLILAIAAGAFIAFGAQATLTVMTGSSENLGWGLAKMLGVITFATGLMMVVLTGAELFTGNVMMAFSVIERKISLMKLLRNWGVVYLGNFIGSLIIALLVYYSALYDGNNYALGALSLKTAYSKANLSFLEAFCRGILCNWLVCLAVWMAISSRRVIGKIFAIFFPIMIFVASGYEHCVANMFFMPNGLLLKNVPEVVQASALTIEQLETLNIKTFLIDNLIPVTLGNIVGVVVFVVLLFWMAYLKEDQQILRK